MHFDADQTEVIFSITPIDDETGEDPEDVVATLDAEGDHYTAVDPSSAIVMITDLPLDPPASPTDVRAVALSRTVVEVAWKMPVESENPDGFIIQASTDSGETFTPVASVYDPAARAFDVTELDPETDYDFRVDAVLDDRDGWWSNDEDDIIGEGDDTASATTTNDQWVDLGSVTPNLATGDLAWFGDGESFPTGTYRILYAGGAYNMGSESFGWCTASNRYTILDDATEEVVTEDALGGVAERESQQEAEYDTWGYSFDFFAGDERIGVRCGEAIGLEDPGPGVTWKLQRIVSTVSIEATDPDAADAGSDSGLFTISRAGTDDSEPLTVYYGVGGTAENGTDYDAIEDSVTIPADEESATIAIDPVEDAVAHGDKTVDLKLFCINEGPGAYAVDRNSSSAEVIIFESETIVSIEATDGSGYEEDLDPGEFTVYRTGSTDESLEVTYEVLGSSTATPGEDYTALSGTVTIPSGENSAKIAVEPLHNEYSDIKTE